MDVPKENFGIRPATVMDPIDRTAYPALADRLSGYLIGEQPDWSYGWRLPPKELKRGRYARNDYQWDSSTSSLSNLAGAFDYALKTDVVSVFASVDLGVMADAIQDRAGGGAPEDWLLDMLHRWDRIPGRGALQQRSRCSTTSMRWLRAKSGSSKTTIRVVLVVTGIMAPVSTVGLDDKSHDASRP